MWFLVAYNLTGQIVAVGTPYNQGHYRRTEDFCEFMKEDLLSGEKYRKYTFKCEQHKKAPKITGKVDSELQHVVQDECYGIGHGLS